MCCIIPSSLGKYRHSFKRHQKEFLEPLPGRIFNIYKVPSHKSHLLAIYIICHLPLVFLSPTSQKFVVLFALFSVRRFLARSIFVCVLVYVVMMPQRKYYDVPYPNIFLEIEKSTKEYMTIQFEHNKYFSEELKEHSVVLEAIMKQLDDISR